MKNYTDIEQSKKLVKILPLESADAFYPWRELMKDYDSIYVPEKMLLSDLEEYDILAWSLAALFNVLPKGTNISISDSLNKIRYVCWNDYVVAYASNPIDACVDMIDGLHELKML